MVITTKKLEGMSRRNLGLPRFNNGAWIAIIIAVSTMLLMTQFVKRRSRMLCLVKTKACKRCGGDLSLEIDQYGAYLGCIQCGAVWSKSDLIPPTLEVENKHRVLAAENISGDH